MRLNSPTRPQQLNITNDKLLSHLVCAFALITLILLGTRPITTSADTEATLVIANLGHPGTLDPHSIDAAWEARIVGDLFVGLVTEAADASIIPGIAKSWELNSDQTVWTFKLRDTSWSDGTPLTAHDFVYSFRRALLPTTEAFYAPGLYAIKNARELHRRTLKDKHALGVRAIDNQTLEITLEAPDAFFLEQLTHPIAYPVPRQAIDGTGELLDIAAVIPDNRPYGIQTTHGARSFTSNGPYRLNEWQSDGLILLKKNPLFYAANGVKVNRVEYQPDTDLAKAMSKFKAGEIHIARDVDTTTNDEFVEEHQGETFITPYLGVYYFTLNLAHPPFKNTAVRQALAMALDRDMITDEVLRNGEVPAYSLVPPGVSELDPTESIPWHSLSIGSRIRKAQELMRQAGYSASKPLKFTLNVNNDDQQHESIALAAKAMWSEIYVMADVTSRDASTHYRLLQAGRFQAGRASWISQHNDASSFLALVHSDVGNLNYGRYSNDEYDGLIQLATVAKAGKDRQRLFSRAQRILLQEQPVIPVYHYVSRNLVSKKINGWLANTKDIQRTRYLSLR